jgi:hypothetical protein
MAGRGCNFPVTMTLIRSQSAERPGPMALATTVSLAALRGPVPLAKGVAALDVLSDGRVVAGVGGRLVTERL